MCARRSTQAKRYVAGVTSVDYYALDLVELAANLAAEVPGVSSVRGFSPYQPLDLWPVSGSAATSAVNGSTLPLRALRSTIDRLAEPAAGPRAGIGWSRPGRTRSG